MKPFVRFQGIWKRDENSTEIATNSTDLDDSILGILVAVDDETGEPVDAAFIQSGEDEDEE